MWGVLLVDSGLAAVFLGLVSLIRPLPWIAGSRRAAGLWLSGGLVTMAAGFLWPAPLQRAAGKKMRLDGFVPAYQFVGSAIGHPCRLLGARVCGEAADAVRKERALSPLI